MKTQNSNFKKYITAGVSVGMVASALVPAVAAEAKTAAFTDVSGNYQDAVDYLVENNLSSGLEDTKYGINAEVKRGDAAIILAKALGLQDQTAPDAGFSDVPDRAAISINSLKKAGIINGKSQTTFGFSDTLKRGEVALMLANAKAYNLSGDVKDVKFTDVSDKYDDAVAGLVKNNITQGVSATQFGTDNPIKRGDFAIFVYKAETLDRVPANVKAVNAAETAAAVNTALLAFENSNFTNLGSASRKEAAELFFAEYAETAFDTEQEVVTALEAVVTTYKDLLAGVNNAQTITAIDRALEALDFGPYENLSSASQLVVSEDFLAAFNARDANNDNTRDSFTTLLAIEKLILEAGDLTPVVSGIENDSTYYASVTPVFGSESTATLDGEAFTSGTTLSNDGDHTLVVTNAAGKTTTVTFTVVLIDTVAELQEGLATDEAVVTVGNNITDADGNKVVISDTVTLNGAGFSIDAPIEITGEDVKVNDLGVSAGNVSGGENAGFYITANNAVLNEVSITGEAVTAGNGVDTPFGSDLEVTVTDSTFTNLLRGFNLNSNDLVATGNTFTNVAYGIGGTENSVITVTGNSFVDAIEAIGLGDGVTVTGAQAGEEVAYLEEQNVFTTVEKKVADYRTPAAE